MSAHAALLLWVAAGQPGAPGERPKTLYESEIAPHRDRLVWYTFRDRLPEVSPLERRGPARPPRVERKAPQAVVSRPPGALRAPQLVWRPLVEVQLPRELRAPNLIAVSPPKRFAAPQPKPAAPAPGPLIAEPPRLAPAARLTVPVETAATAAPKPVPRPFQAPAPRRDTPQQPVLAAPALEVAVNLNPKLPVFAQPAQPAAPTRRQFAAPVRSAPELQPELELPSGALTAAIVGLNPSATLESPLPEASRPAAFSAGPEPGRGSGNGEPVESARIFVPDLMVRGGARDGRPTLMARAAPTSIENLRAAAHAAPARAAPPPASPALRVSAAPVPQLEGRTVYSMAVQTPNTTSYSGSWIIWFAERAPAPSAAALYPPEPLRKVDPKYIAAAADERVEGKVRLAAVIRRDGSVDGIVLIQSLDVRLDRSAQEALAKWNFAPARRGNAAIELDAVIEIPFRLQPRAAR
ncbi:MAG: TonB family protein [Bryobacteraceae bacterium]